MVGEDRYHFLVGSAFGRGGEDADFVLPFRNFLHFLFASARLDFYAQRNTFF